MTRFDSEIAWELTKIILCIGGGLFLYLNRYGISEYIIYAFMG